ncbi:CrcB-like protein-domain-containing protein [Fomitopsis serialis]|uniref:CrcB-like protein-domain-containing protein n=1 Tax=Fomitopsis serialis TaxID=139415 RepID=UPI0020073C58|nr:CrcB-like protein-domain-containing protein [Neoantrodia serialis]KAH9938199.1 CrcB-like protein-domain-containing protein [Neoantrodia serialis]
MGQAQDVHIPEVHPDDLESNPPPTDSAKPSRSQSQNEVDAGAGTHSERAPSDVGSALARHASLNDAASLASIDRPPSEPEKIPAAKIYHPYHPAVLALLMPASVFGCLARLGVDALVSFDGAAIFPLAWVQVGGCLVMGFCLGIREPFGRFYGPLYTAFTTGFCGSFTTFSSWQYAVFQAWINSGRYHRDWLRDVSHRRPHPTPLHTRPILSAVQFGTHLATLIAPHFPRPPSPNRVVRYSLTALSVCIYAATFPAYSRMPESFRHQATSALLYSFPGTLTRYLLSINLNRRLKLFPLGTFAANILGTGLIGLFEVLQSTHGPLSVNACNVLNGLANGYCGCLTTVSTFATEVDALESKKAWFYVILSVVCSQLLLLVILGPSYWAGHVSEQLTCKYVP